VGTLTVGGATLNTGSTFQVTLNGAAGRAVSASSPTAGSIALVGGPMVGGFARLSRRPPLTTFVVLHNLGSGTLTGNVRRRPPGRSPPVTIGGLAFHD